jgi:hypothetical protein
MVRTARGLRCSSTNSFRMFEGLLVLWLVALGAAHTSDTYRVIGVWDCAVGAIGSPLAFQPGAKVSATYGGQVYAGSYVCDDDACTRVSISWLPPVPATILSVLQINSNGRSGELQVTGAGTASCTLRCDSAAARANALATAKRVSSKLSAFANSLQANGYGWFSALYVNMTENEIVLSDQMSRFCYPSFVAAFLDAFAKLYLSPLQTGNIPSWWQRYYVLDLCGYTDSPTGNGTGTSLGFTFVCACLFDAMTAHIVGDMKFALVDAYKAVPSPATPFDAYHRDLFGPVFDDVLSTSQSWMLTALSSRYPGMLSSIVSWFASKGLSSSIINSWRQDAWVTASANVGSIPSENKSRKK